MEEEALRFLSPVFGFDVFSMVANYDYIMVDIYTDSSFGSALLSFAFAQHEQLRKFALLAGRAEEESTQYLAPTS